MFLNLLKNNLVGDDFSNLIIHERDLTEALKVGLSRAPRKNHDFEFTLADFAYVMRGIATGANEFFFLTRKRADEIGIPDGFLLSAVGRTRDMEGSYLTKESISELEKNVGGAQALDNLLTQQGQTKASLKTQLIIQLSIEKLYASQATVSAQEVNEFIAQNQSQLVATDSAGQLKEAQESLKQQKLSQIFNEKFQQIKQSAKIQIF